MQFAPRALTAKNAYLQALNAPTGAMARRLPALSAERDLKVKIGLLAGTDGNASEDPSGSAGQGANKKNDAPRVRRLAVKFADPASAKTELESQDQLQVSIYWEGQDKKPVQEPSV
jgi:hypothetical protein